MAKAKESGLLVRHEDVMPVVLGELRRPIGDVTTAVEWLLEDVEDEDLYHDLHQILCSLRRVELGFEGLGVVGRSLRSVQGHAVDETLRDSFRVFGKRARQNRLRVSSSLPDLPRLPYDPAALRAIVFHLTSNAMAACQSGDAVTLSCRLDPGMQFFEVSVEDTGKGMDTATCARCTEPYFSTDRDASGVGLSMCRTSVEAVGGSLTVESALGRGTVVTFRLPIIGGLWVV